jgi:hypothetical protein
MLSKEVLQCLQIDVELPGARLCKRPCKFRIASFRLSALVATAARTRAYPHDT